MAKKTADERIVAKARWRLKYLRLLGLVFLLLAVGQACLMVPLLIEFYQAMQQPPDVIVVKTPEGQTDFEIAFPPGFYQSQGFMFALGFISCVQLVVLAIAILCWPKRADRLLIHCWDACQAAEITPSDDCKS